MTQGDQKIQEIEARLRKAISAARERDVKISHGGFGVTWDDGMWRVTAEGKCCPIGALLLEEQPKPIEWPFPDKRTPALYRNSPSRAAEAVLGLEIGDLNEFVRAYDDMCLADDSEVEPQLDPDYSQPLLDLAMRLAHERGLEQTP